MCVHGVLWIFSICEVLNVTEETTSFLDQKLEKETIGRFLEKSKYAGKDQKATITNVQESQKFKGKLVLTLNIDGEEEERLLTIGPKNKNQLIEMFGASPRSWISKDVVMTFGLVQTYEITRNNQTQTQEGCEIDFSSG